MARVKVLYISQASGGVQRHITLLVSHLDQDRFEVTGCFPPLDRVKGITSGKETFFDAFHRFGFRTIPLDMYREIRPFQDVKAFLGLLRILKQERWDIVHTHSSKAGFLGRIAARLVGVPVVIHTPNAFAFDRPPHLFLNFFYAFLERIAGYFCDALIAVSPSEGELARSAKVLPAQKIVQICNGVDLKEFEFEVDPRMKKKALGIPEERPMVLTVGRFAPQKAPGVFIDAAERVLAENRDVTFVMIGDGPLFQRVLERVHKGNFRDRLFLLEWRSDVKEIIASCDVYVLSSLWEGLPYTVLEAMVLRKPVVATAARGTRDVVQEGVTGFLVGLHDEKGMAEKILTLLLDPPLARKMGEKGRFLVEQDFTLETHVQKTEALYERLLTEKKREK
ncbi:MAG: glycosyltransferase family 4 protein [Candidatus Omnitrophica bacterium]|nr:glycosyltransferase family 4 protein [Candidatus Omnitrophota bacterium]